METREYFEKVMQDYNQNRNGMGDWNRNRDRRRKKSEVNKSEKDLADWQK